MVPPYHCAQVTLSRQVRDCRPRNHGTYTAQQAEKRKERCHQFQRYQKPTNLQRIPSTVVFFSPRHPSSRACRRHLPLPHRCSSTPVARVDTSRSLVWSLYEAKFPSTALGRSGIDVASQWDQELNPTGHPHHRHLRKRTFSRSDYHR